MSKYHSKAVQEIKAETDITTFKVYIRINEVKYSIVICLFQITGVNGGEEETFCIA